MLRVMLVDDEPPARRGLRRMIEAHADVQVLGEAGSIAEAAELLGRLAPDGLFLDVELGDGFGFDLLERLEQPPGLVFVTGHGSYGPRAFDVAAVDYLLKPVAEARLALALERLRHFRAADTEDDAPGAEPRLHLRMAGHSVLVAITQIISLTAEGDFTRVLTTEGQEYFVCRLLGAFEAELPTPPFFRVSRSLIINLDQVGGLKAVGGGRAQVSFTAGVEPLVLGRLPSRRLTRQLAEAGRRLQRRGLPSELMK
jgi:two-component system LytT family response regulator